MNRSLLLDYNDQIKSDVRYADYLTYQDYIDSIVRESDVNYLRNKTFARAVAAFGHRSYVEAIRPEVYAKRQKKASASVKPIPTVPVVLSTSTPPSIICDSLVQALMVRERANRTGLLSTIIYMKVLSKKGNIINAFIDYFQRLTLTDMSGVFQCKELFTPSTTDLWYYVHPTDTYAKNNSVLYQTIVDPYKGLRFLYKEDNLIVDPNKEDPGPNTTKLSIKNKRCIQLIFYDHAPRRRTFC